LEVGAERLRALDDDSRRALLIAATVADGTQDTIARALALDGRSLADLDAAEEAEVVAFDGGRLVFRHPTLRSAAYHGASASDRRLAHRLVGQVAPSPERQALHLALGAEGPDAELLARVEAAADALAARGAPVEAARAHELAARLAAEPRDGARQLRLAAELLVDTPEAGAVLDLLDRAALAERSVVEQAEAERVRLRFASRQGDDDATLDRLQALAAALGEDEPSLAAGLLLEALPSLVRQRRVVDVVAVAQQAHAFAEAGDDRAVRRRADVAIGGALVAMGDPAGGPLLEEYRELIDEEGPTRAGPFLAEVAAPVLGFLHRTDDARALLARLEADLRRRGALPVLAPVLAAKAAILHGPDLVGSIGAAQEAIELAEELRHPGLVAMPAASLAVAAAMRGDAGLTEGAVAVLHRCGGDINRECGEIARGALALGQGRLDDALAVYEELAVTAGVGTGHLRWEPEWAEALIRAQRRDDARKVLDDLDAAGGPGWAVAGVARVEAMLAEDDEVAAGPFQTSIDLMALAGNDVGEGRTELVWGERLRRARRRAAARPHLERAVELLSACGAAVWAERASAELSLAGGAPAVTGAEELTPQELQVARLAASGASNRDIGHELFVSPRTVEAHLTTVFRKLGVRNRRELAARAVEDERLRPVS
jgi:DNA-binding CsgD family transcriptional regulator